MQSTPRLINLNEFKTLSGNNYSLLTKKESLSNIKNNDIEIFNKLKNFDENDEISLQYDHKNDQISCILVSSLNSLLNDYLILRNNLKDNPEFTNNYNLFFKDKFPIKLGTDYLNFNEIKSYLLLNKLSEKSPLKNFSDNLIKNLEICKNKFSLFRIIFSFIKEDNKKKIITELLGSNTIERRLHKNVYKRKSKDFIRVKNNDCVTMIDDEEIRILDPLNFNKNKPKIKVNKKFAIKKVSNKFNEKEFEESENNNKKKYVPVHMRNDNLKKSISNIELYISGYPEYTTEDDLRYLLNNTLYKQFDDQRFIKSIYFAKRQKNGFTSCFSFVRFFEKKHANFIVEKELRLHSTILIVSWKEKN